MCASKKLASTLSLVASLLASATCLAGIPSKTVEYSADSKAFEGLFVSSNQNKGDRT